MLQVGVTAKKLKITCNVAMSDELTELAGCCEAVEEVWSEGFPPESAANLRAAKSSLEGFTSSVIMCLSVLSGPEEASLCPDPGNCIKK